MAVAPLTAEKDSVLLVQLTDCHLFGNPGGKLLGMDTADSLQRVVDLVLAEQPGIDLVLATGDLSQDGSLASYERFRTLSERIQAPARWCPGNHDELAIMREASRDTDLMQPVLDIGAWRVVMLDTLVPGSVHGMLREDQLQLLDRALGEAPDRHHLICLHHHPVTIGSRWMDKIGLRNRDALFEVVDRHPGVKALLWGHIHQAFDAAREGFAFWRHLRPVCNSRQAARISTWTPVPRGIAGCGCMRMDVWTREFRGWLESISRSTTASRGY